jgi:hypothetical protein
MRNNVKLSEVEFIKSSNLIWGVVAKKCFAQAAELLPQSTTRDTPSIRIEPQESLVQKAVDEIKKIEPNYFVGIEQIKVENTGGSYGKSESGPGKDPTIIYLNSEKIKADTKTKAQNAPAEKLEEIIVEEIVDTIAHEKGHIIPFKQRGQFGSETEAELEAKKITNRLKAASKK